MDLLIKSFNLLDFLSKSKSKLTGIGSSAPQPLHTAYVEFSLNIKILDLNFVSSNEDLQKEIVDQKGIDFEYFLKYGYYNNDHKPGFENKVGQPVECKMTKEGLWTKGYLFENHKVADNIWELANALESSKSDRKLGFSVQGKVIRRAGNRILKCWVQDIAITTAPINTNTWIDVVKSLSSVPKDLWTNEPFEISPHRISPVTGSCGLCFKSKLAIDPSIIDLKKKEDKDDEDENKALSTTGPGSVLIPESLEGDAKVQTHKECRYNKSLTFNDCISRLKTTRNLSHEDATTVAEAVFELMT